MEHPITPAPDSTRHQRWERSIIAELTRRGADPSLLMPDELEQLMMLRERSDAAYGAYLDAADAAQKAQRVKDYAQADFERCLHHMVNSLHFSEPIARTRQANTERE